MERPPNIHRGRYARRRTIVGRHAQRPDAERSGLRHVRISHRILHSQRRQQRVADHRHSDAEPLWCKLCHKARRRDGRRRCGLAECGSNVITVEVTAEDDSTTQTYTVTVTRAAPPSTDATLSALTLSAIDFGTFDSTTTSYTGQVANSVSQTTVTPTVNHSGQAMSSSSAV